MGRNMCYSTRPNVKTVVNFLLSTLVNHSSSTDDSTDEPVATERGRKRVKLGAKKRNRSVSNGSGQFYNFCIFIDITFKLNLCTMSV